MSKLRLLTITLLVAMLLPLGMVAAQEESTTTPEDTVLYETQSDDYNYEDYTWDYDSQPQDLMYRTNDAIDPEEATALAGFMALFAGVYMVVVLTISAGTYIFMGLALSKIGKELGYENPWFAWVPVLNTIMMFQLGEQNPWLLLLLLIPGIGAFVVAILGIIAMANITAKRGYEKLLVLLFLVPFGMFVLMYLLAWKPKSVSAPAEQAPTM